MRSFVQMALRCKQVEDCNASLEQRVAELQQSEQLRAESATSAQQACVALQKLGALEQRLDEARSVAARSSSLAHQLDESKTGCEQMQQEVKAWLLQQLSELNGLKTQVSSAKQCTQAPFNGMAATSYGMLKTISSYDPDTIADLLKSQIDEGWMYTCSCVSKKRRWARSQREHRSHPTTPCQPLG